MLNQLPTLTKAPKPTKKFTKAFVLDDESILTRYEELSSKLNLRSQQDVFEYMIRCTNYVLTLHENKGQSDEE